jgi:hypothetical protein
MLKLMDIHSMYKVKIALKRLLLCIKGYVQYNNGYGMSRITKCRCLMLCSTSDECWKSVLFTVRDIIYSRHDTIMDTVLVTWISMYDTNSGHSIYTMRNMLLLWFSCAGKSLENGMGYKKEDSHARTRRRSGERGGKGDRVWMENGWTGWKEETKSQ